MHCFAFVFYVWCRYIVLIDKAEHQFPHKQLMLLHYGNVERLNVGYKPYT